MPLQPDDQLENSAVVANCCMNRERQLRGSNGYDRELRLDPVEFLLAASERSRPVRWLDLCCGTGTALLEAAELLDGHRSGDEEESDDAESLAFEIVGVDLAGMFRPGGHENLSLVEASLSEWQPEGSFDLITCVHGLHYIGDKLNLILRAQSWLAPGGRFVANLDLDNLKIGGVPITGRVFASEFGYAGWTYLSRQRLVQCGDGIDCEFRLRYLGADDQAGPNYTGQSAVDSHYERVS